MNDATPLQRALDPATPLQELADLAFQHPETRAAVAGNPSTYPDLLTWLAALRDPEVDRALAERGMVPHPMTGPESAPAPAAQTVPTGEVSAGEPPTIAGTPASVDEAPTAAKSGPSSRTIAIVAGIAVLAIIGASIGVAQAVGHRNQSTASGGIAEPEPEDVQDPTPTPTETPTPEPAPLPQQTYTTTIDQGGGFTQTVKVTLGPVVLGSDTRLMDSQWASVGGDGTNPCLNINPANDMTTNYVIQTQFAGYAFGTLTVTNGAPDFPPRQQGFQFVRNGGGAAMGAGFSNGGKCDGLNSGGFILTPSWGDGKRPQWGPVPIVVAIADVRSPEFPLGDEAKVTQYPVKLFLKDLTIPLVLYKP